MDEPEISIARPIIGVLFAPVIVSQDGVLKSIRKFFKQSSRGV